MADPNPNFTDSPDSFRPPALDESGAVRETPPVPPTTGLTPEERQWGMFCHLSAILASALSGISVLGPLICWMVKKDTSKFVDRHGKEAVNFHLNMMVWVLLSIPVAIVTCGIGAALTGAIYVYALVFSIIAGLKANNGEEYKYPAIIRVVK
jgi:uncharacterized Tic20 family protein